MRTFDYRCVECTANAVLLRYGIGCNVAQSITDKIIAAITAALEAAKPDGMTVERSRRRPVETAELPLTTVRPVNERVNKATENTRSPAVKRALTVAVMVRTTGEDVDLDPLRTYAVEAVMGDITLGGLAIEVEETEHEWETDEGTDADYVEDLITFVVTYQTSRKTPVSK